MILISGGQLIIGWENNPILTNVTIVLNGEFSTIPIVLPQGYDQINSKGIGVRKIKSNLIKIFKIYYFNQK
jgi:hypothetical protein